MTTISAGADTSHPASPQRPSGPRWAAGLALLTALGLLGWTWLTWPDVQRLATGIPETTAFMERDAARGITVRWQWVPASQISAHLFRAILVAEDIEFFAHDGFSTSEIRAALEGAVAGERLRGASTITQQLAKNLWLDPSRTTGRKLREALLTWQLERALSKRRILELYANLVQFGPGIYGAEAAARHYFGKSAAALTERDAAQLAAGLSRPSTWNPASMSNAYGARVELVLDRMARARFVWRHIDGTIPKPEPLRLDTLLPESLPPVPYPLVPPPDSIRADSIRDTIPPER